MDRLKIFEEISRLSESKNVNNIKLKLDCKDHYSVNKVDKLSFNYSESFGVKLTHEIRMNEDNYQEVLEFLKEIK